MHKQPTLRFAGREAADRDKLKVFVSTSFPSIFILLVAIKLRDFNSAVISSSETPQARTTNDAFRRCSEIYVDNM